MSEEEILFEKKDNVATITINRPSVLNSLNTKALNKLVDTFKKADKDPEVRAVIFTGAGRAFCVGADINEVKDAGPWQMAQYNRLWLNFLQCIETMSKPVIAAINGYVNMEVYQTCDIAVASEDARIALPEINIGVIPGAGVTQRLPRWVGIFKAKEIIFSGDWINAEEAERIGLVNKVVPRDKFKDEVEGMAKKLASKAPLALSFAKRVVNVGSEMDLQRGIEYALREFLLLFTTEDQKEGMKAFLEKRPPKYTGK